MYGRRMSEHTYCAEPGCCNTKRGLRAREERQWQAEANQELEEHPDGY